jgi:hypothetical protein
MKRVLFTASATVLLVVALGGCSDDKDDPVVGATPALSSTPEGGGSASEPLAGKDLECKDEIVRQMTDPTQETDETPPECQDLSDERILQLVEIADAEVKKDSPSPSPS